MDHDHGLRDLINSGPILITGVTGFKGTWLSLILRDLGAEVHGIGLPPSPESLFKMVNNDDLIESTVIDITNYYELKKYLSKLRPVVIFHLAAQSLVIDSYKEPIRTFEVNSLGTANLLDICLNVDSVKYIGVTTTDKVYKQSSFSKSFVEEDVLFGFDPYSMSKVSCEIVCASWHNLSSSVDGPMINTFRAGNVIGGGDLSKNRLIPDLVRNFQNKTTLNVRNPESTRPWSHVTSILFGYLLAASFGLKQKSLNIRKSSTLDSFNFGPTESSLNVRTVVEIFNQEMMENRRLNIDKTIETENFNLLKEALYLDLDSSKAKKYLGWQPCYDQVGSIKKTFYWWQQVITGGVTPLKACLDDIDQAKIFYDSSLNYQ